MTPEQKIEILKDALQQLGTGRYRAQAGHYVDAYNKLNGVTLDCTIQKIANSLDTRQEGFCSVCANGALLMSALRKQPGKFDTEVIHANNKTKQALDHSFGWNREEFTLMETYFECRIVGLDDYGSQLKYIDYWERRGIDRRNDTAKMVHIFTNAIKNNGIFIPED